MDKTKETTVMGGSTASRKQNRLDMELLSALKANWMNTNQFACQRAKPKVNWRALVGGVS